MYFYSSSDLRGTARELEGGGMASVCVCESMYVSQEVALSVSCWMFFFLSIVSQVGMATKGNIVCEIY